LPLWIGNVWQEGYGVVSFREPELAVVVRYVQDQGRRHAEQQLDADWERWQDANEGP
jgi:REP element-mobilizing transposase RayT